MYRAVFDDDNTVFPEVYNNGLSSPNHFHFTTITGIVEDTESDVIWLRVQSWGYEFYINVEELLYYNETVVNAASNAGLSINPECVLIIPCR